MKVAIRLMMTERDKLWGPGLITLLKNIQSFESIKEASRAMGMSYNKALRILRTTEKELGFPIVISEKGGIQRGGTILTPSGKKLLETFQEIEQEVLAYAQKLVDEKLIF